MCVCGGKPELPMWEMLKVISTGAHFESGTKTRRKVGTGVSYTRHMAHVFSSDLIASSATA